MKRSIIFLVILAACIALADYACNTDRTPMIVGLNQNIHHDDFEYSVSDFIVIPRIITNNDTISAKGNFYVVNFKVTNNAKRVGHRWDNSIAYITDENGNRYENNTVYQKAINESKPFGYKDVYNTPHGSTGTTVLIFEIPSDVKKPYLKVKGEILMGDALNGARFKRMKIMLF